MQGNAVIPYYIIKQRFNQNWSYVKRTQKPSQFWDLSVEV